MEQILPVRYGQVQSGIYPMEDLQNEERSEEAGKTDTNNCQNNISSTMKEWIGTSLRK